MGRGEEETKPEAARVVCSQRLLALHCAELKVLIDKEKKLVVQYHRFVGGARGAYVALVKVPPLKKRLIFRHFGEY
ncbi:hypothetical protein TcWFU_006371 [Taenia crassiceps]|uniref:Uncharacterized protein n=1 Tax=Taenia crassiceps TaxID=6207 RepID=A0ABR4QRM5_9CEST